MFFQWHLGQSKFTSCYIDSIVPTIEDGLAANKSYTSSGSITEIQIWNVTTPVEGMTNLSWNTRPQRIALMGTVAFLPEKEKIEQLGLEDGWQSQLATRFSCGKEAAVITVEVACNSCRLEFEQIFSVPPLGEYGGVTGLNWRTDLMMYHSFRPDGNRISIIQGMERNEFQTPSALFDTSMVSISYVHHLAPNERGVSKIMVEPGEQNVDKLVRQIASCENHSYVATSTCLPCTKC